MPVISTQPTTPQPVEMASALLTKAKAGGYTAAGHIDAVNHLAGTKNWPLVGALNVIAGNAPAHYREIEGVLNQLAGTTGWGENAAASRWAAVI